MLRKCRRCNASKVSSLQNGLVYAVKCRDFNQSIKSFVDVLKTLTSTRNTSEISSYIISSNSTVN